MDFFQVVSEDRIKKAYQDGEFEKLPGLGKPLPKDDLSGVPEELRMAYRMMKNAGYTDEERNLRQEIMSIEGLIHKCENPDEKEQLQKNLNEKLLRFNKVMSQRGVQTNSHIFKNYEQKIQKKFR